MPGKKRNRITVAASADGIRRAERALVRHGFNNQSNFAKAQGIGRSSVTNFFNQNPVQVETFKAICESLRLNHLEIMEEKYFVDELALETAGQRLEAAPASQIEVKHPTVSASRDAQCQMIITLAGDFDRIDPEILKTILEDRYGFDVLDIQAGSIKIVIQGPEPESHRLIQQIADSEVEDIFGYPVESVQILSQELLSTYLKRSNPSDKWELVRQILLGTLDKSKLAEVDLSDSDLSRANLSGANLIKTNLLGANLSEADLSRAYLLGANLNGANLNGANLSEADLSEAYLSGANLLGANLSEANLSGANPLGANLSEADLSRAYLLGANLNGANLNGANLNGADLLGADLSRANLSGSNLSGANVRLARFIDVMGMTPELQTDLESRGAIFEDSTGDRETSASPVPSKR